MRIIESNKAQARSGPLSKKEGNAKFVGSLVHLAKRAASLYTRFTAKYVIPSQPILNRTVTLPKSPILDTPWIFKANQQQAEKVIASMSMRANKAGQDILESIKFHNSSGEVFVASNGKEEDEARFAILLTNDHPPIYKSTEKAEQSVDPSTVVDMEKLIDDCLWVETLVSDPKTGLGGKLLDLAETIASEKGKSGIALSAFEFDPQDDDKNSSEAPYSIADYYAKKKGFIYTGQAHEELGQQEAGEAAHYFYPIYVKPLSSAINLLKKIEDWD
ncbi:MAG: hypothetical protein QS721_03170 [Candidatus Endonucleobacter sp. (ex Gigantidas childressi)]|nr:hypothetical protein [Candidatus Endonucleobacter sp. (ex Gigantidas childressi)]